MLRKTFLQQALQVNCRGDVAIVKTGNDYSFYLVELICDSCTSESETKDDFNRIYHPGHRTEIHLEIHKDTKDRIIYLENKRKASISCFSIVKFTPEVEFIHGKRRWKIEDMYLVTHDVHEAICSLTLCEF